MKAISPAPGERELKRAALKDQIEEFIGNHERSNPHHLRTSQIVAEFIEHGEKNVRRAVKELR